MLISSSEAGLASILSMEYSHVRTMLGEGSVATVLKEEAAVMAVTAALQAPDPAWSGVVAAADSCQVGGGRIGGARVGGGRVGGGRVGGGWLGGGRVGGGRVGGAGVGERRMGGGRLRGIQWGRVW